MENKALTIYDLWLGMDVWVRFDGDETVYYNGKVVGITDDPGPSVLIDRDDSDWYDFSSVKPILRRWDSMTDDELQEMILSGVSEPYKNQKREVFMRKNPDRIVVDNMKTGKTWSFFRDGIPYFCARWCQERGIDYMGWIDDGLAIDVETLNQKGESNGK